MKINIKTFYLLFLFVTYQYAVTAQLIYIHPAESDFKMFSFNQNFIQKKKIKIITVSYADKKDEFAIEDRGIKEEYNFDTNGLLQRHYITVLKSRDAIEKTIPAVYKKGKLIKPKETITEYIFTFDTTFTWFKYDQQNRLVMKRTAIGDYFSTVYYMYDDNGNVIKETTCKETNKNISKHYFVPGTQTVLTEELYEYVQQGSYQIKKKCLNDLGSVYKEGITNLKPGSINIDYRYLYGYIKFGYEFKLNEKMLVTDYLYYSNVTSDIRDKTVYEYDDKNNLLKEKYYKSEKEIYFSNYFYEENGNLIKNRLKRIHEKKMIEIAKFSYEYFP